MNWYGPDLGREITYKDCLGYCYFCAVSSNGTTSVCETARILSICTSTDDFDDTHVYRYFNIHRNKITSHFDKFMHDEAKSPLGMSDFLYNFGKFHVVSQPGLGTHKRSQSSCCNAGTN